MRREAVNFLVAVSAVLGLTFGGLMHDANASDKKPIGKVSMFEINDLSGPTSDATIPHHNGLSDHLKYTNENGGIVYNDPKTGKEERVIIQFKFGDNKAQAAPVPTLYARFMGMEPRPILFIPGSTAAAETAMKWIKRDKVVSASMVASVRTLFPAGWHNGYFPDYPAQPCLMAKWAMEDWRSKGHKEAPKWAWFTLDIPYGRAPITPESENYIRSLGFEIVGTWTMPFNPVDLSAELNAMYSKGVNYFYGNLIVLQTNILLKTLKSLGLQGKMQPLGMVGTMVEGMVKVAGNDLLEGYTGIRFTADISELDKPGVKIGKILAEKNNRFFETNYMEGIGYGILTANTMKAALEKKGYPITGEDLMAAWEDPNGLDSGGIFPILKFTPTEKRGVRKAHVAEFRDGKIVRITKDLDLPDTKPGGPWTPKK